MTLQQMSITNKPDGCRHSSPSDGSNYIRKNVIFLAFDGKCLGEANDGSLGGGVICLTESAVYVPIASYFY